MVSIVGWRLSCFEAEERKTRSLRVVLITSTGVEGKSLAYPWMYFETWWSWAPVQEKRRMSEGVFEVFDCQVSMD